MTKLTGLEGKLFHYWTVITQAESRKSQTYWSCICKCGVSREVLGTNLVRGVSKSCGCYSVEISTARLTTHGMYGTTERKSWSAMKGRCNNKKDLAYEYYGGRGIKICERWDKFENFYEDMGPKPTKKHSLDRIDNDGDYEPGNCKWSTKHEQSINRRSTQAIIGVQPGKGGRWSWRTREGSKNHTGTCQTKLLAAKAYDDKCEELGRGRPNNTKGESE